ncbi:MAG: response regulator transcription factor [Chloroflexota bacterium]|jgi:DNA-binding response OmpR family regulator|nr:response regulator transcription factor [Chloroflexota bacterium]
MTKILLVEDEGILRTTLAQQLEAEGYQVLTAADGERGLELAREGSPDLCIFDVMLPRLDGLSLCRIVSKEQEVPIILLTARSAEMDRVIGLDSGADDYIVKPFGLSELLARIRSALRRASKHSETVLRLGPVVIDFASHRVWVNDKEVKLSSKEFGLLATLMRNRGIVLVRDTLLSEVWGMDFEGDPRTLDVHIRWLRMKLEADPDRPELIKTVRGVGYRID